MAAASNNSLTRQVIGGALLLSAGLALETYHSIHGSETPSPLTAWAAVAYACSIQTWADKKIALLSLAARLTSAPWDSVAQFGQIALASAPFVAVGTFYAQQKLTSFFRPDLTSSSGAPVRT